MYRDLTSKQIIAKSDNGNIHWFLRQNAYEKGKYHSIDVTYDDEATMWVYGGIPGASFITGVNTVSFVRRAKQHGT